MERKRKKQKDMSTEISNTEHCCFCGAKIKKESNSLHIWEIEYECGYKIYGAIDTETHGNGITVDEECSNFK